jgi:hypothetical protein
MVTFQPDEVKPMKRMILFSAFCLMTLGAGSFAQSPLGHPLHGLDLEKDF